MTPPPCIAPPFDISPGENLGKAFHFSVVFKRARKFIFLLFIILLSVKSLQ